MSERYGPCGRRAMDRLGAPASGVTVTMCYNNGLLLPLCMMQNGYCLARTFRRRSVSSSGGLSITASLSTLDPVFELGCLTILAVGNAVSGMLTGVVVTETTLGFI